MTAEYADSNSYRKEHAIFFNAKLKDVCHVQVEFLGVCGDLQSTVYADTHYWPQRGIGFATVHPVRIRPVTFTLLQRSDGVQTFGG